jgi:hypothetical protein
MNKVYQSPQYFDIYTPVTCVMAIKYAKPNNIYLTFQNIINSNTFNVNGKYFILF